MAQSRVKVVLNQTLLAGSDEPNLVQRVATVYLETRQLRVSAPPEATGKALDWVGQFSVTELTGPLSEQVVDNADRTRIVELVRAELQKREIQASAKPRPADVAQVCRNGHLIVGSANRFPQFKKSFCQECGAATIDACQSCDWPIEGIGQEDWMSNMGPYRPPKYCGQCGNPFPWTETALLAAKEYTDELDLNPDEKAQLKRTLDDLTRDSDRTPLAVSRFKKFISKIGPQAGAVLQKIIENVLTETANRMITGRM